MTWASHGAVTWWALLVSVTGGGTGSLPYLDIRSKDRDFMALDAPPLCKYLASNGAPSLFNLKPADLTKKNITQTNPHATMLYRPYLNSSPTNPGTPLGNATWPSCGKVSGIVRAFYLRK